jgi:Fur family transcriptional regulator, ferric uptake regulator
LRPSIITGMRETTPTAWTSSPGIAETLGSAGHRLTGPRLAVAELVAARGGGHFTAADIAADTRSRRSGVGRATIFRTIDLLLEIGAIERIDLPDGEHAYVACQGVHHHHVVCTGCGRSTGVDDTELRAALGTIGRATGYVIDDHRLELYGRCPACRDPESPATRVGHEEGQ